jgi:hypothetical protein
MRVFIAISIVVASVSSTFAQSAMDNSRAAEGAPQQTNFYVSSSGTVKIVSRAAEDMKGDQAAQAAWSERCRPIVVEDREGLRRVKYAERDCDLSRLNTAGN